MTFSVRRYDKSDEPSWLRCRLLGFFDSSYFDDVHRTKPALNPGSIELVAVDDGGEIVGILDVEVAEDSSTIDCIVVAPTTRGQGVATALFEFARRLLPDSVRSIDAWTREDAAANAWYLKSGFSVAFRYLHVYLDSNADSPEAVEGFETPSGLSRPVTAFMHAPIGQEVELRARFRRVHECRQYVLDLKPDYNG